MSLVKFPSNHCDDTLNECDRARTHCGEKILMNRNVRMKMLFRWAGAHTNTVVYVPNIYYDRATTMIIIRIGCAVRVFRQSDPLVLFMYQTFGKWRA